MAAPLITLVFLQALPIPLYPVPPGESARLVPEDQAVLELRESRQDLPCELRPVKPSLGFDLQLHAGYEVTVPWAELAQRGDALKVLLRISGRRPERAPVYFSQIIKTPPIPAEPSGALQVSGSFNAGEGSYHADWLMRASSGRVCSHNWDFDAVLPRGVRDLPDPLPSGTVAAAETDLFAREPPADRSGGAALKLKFLVNISPAEAGAAVLREDDLDAVVSTLRALSRDPNVQQVSVTVFQLNDPRLLYRQKPSSQIEFPEVGRAVSLAQHATVSLDTLSRKHASEEFLATLLQEEASDGYEPDAMIFVGPQSFTAESISNESLSASPTPECPVFYLNHGYSGISSGWRDAISRLVKRFRGREYTFSRPLDMWSSVKEVLTHIERAAAGRPRS